MSGAVGSAAGNAVAGATGDIQKTNEASEKVDAEETKAKMDKKGRDGAKNLI